MPLSGPTGQPEHDVAIVGAGAAGLAAAAILRAAGLRCILLEGGRRIGGRAHTAHPDCLSGARFDIGATWLHQTDRNPLVSLARARGISLSPAHRGARRLFVGDRRARPDEVADYEAGYQDWERVVLQRADGPDTTLSDASGPAGVWTASIENWEGAIIAAADADRLSLHDWRRNLLDESDLSPPAGVGALLADLVGPLAGPVRFDSAVEAIDWRDAAVCRLLTRRGPVSARTVIVTVSTGVLRAGRIAFDPPLPASTRRAIDGLPMGLLSKLALPATGPATGNDRLGLAPGTLLERRLERRGNPGMLIAAWPAGLPYLSGFFGGRYAESLAARPEAALADARAILRRLLGPDLDGAIAPDAGFVTEWGTDPLFGGAYSFCPPGQAGARARLAEPVAERLLFAGEACRSDGLAGTVGGALADGERAAAWLLRHCFGRNTVPALADGFPPPPNPV